MKQRLSSGYFRSANIDVAHNTEFHLDYESYPDKFHEGE